MNRIEGIVNIFAEPAKYIEHSRTQVPFGWLGEKSKLTRAILWTQRGPSQCPCHCFLDTGFILRGLVNKHGEQLRASPDFFTTRAEIWTFGATQSPCFGPTFLCYLESAVNVTLPNRRCHKHHRSAMWIPLGVSWGQYSWDMEEEQRREPGWRPGRKDTPHPKRDTKTLWPGPDDGQHRDGQRGRCSTLLHTITAPSLQMPKGPGQRQSL